MPHTTPIPLNNNQLPFNPKGYQNTYGILIKYPHKNLTVHYETSISFLNYAHANSYIVKLHRKQVYINNKLPADKLYEMAGEMAAAIYPVIIEINKDNKITAIINQQEIIERSKAAVAKLSNYFEGSAAEDCFSLFKTHCSNPNLLIAGLQNDFFYSVFFLPLHTKYDEQLKAALTTELKLGSSKYLFSTTIQLADTYNEKDKIIADVMGTCEEAQFAAQYQLYAEDHTIYCIAGTANYINKQKEDAAIEFEVYHLNSEEREIKGKPSFKKIVTVNEHSMQSILTDEEEVPIKKSIWSFFSK